MINIFYLILIFIVLQRIAELTYSNYNTKRLILEGAKEYYKDHYPLFIILHGTWIISIIFFIPHNTSANIFFLIVFIILQILRVWVIITLGKYWTTRIIRIKNSTLVKKGPYKFIKHPNYLIVFFEILILPLIFSATELSIIFTILNALLLLYRIKLENKAILETT
mgnify:CR=1 FL=1|tara:strand:+ start:329 stop:826 length:498 start_codon:yes stop_codon:yes gene_type:complete